MRINPNPKAPVTGELGEATPSGARAAAGTSHSAALAADTAKLSADSSRVQSLTALVAGLPEIRQEKVAALGLAIQRGSYNVSPEQTAAALVGEMEARFAA